MGDVIGGGVTDGPRSRVVIWTMGLAAQKEEEVRGREGLNVLLLATGGAEIE